MRNCRWLGTVLAAALCAAPAAWAQTAATEPVEQDIDRTVIGEVVTATRSALSVEFSQSADAAEEMLLPLDQDVVMEGAKKLAELAPGDRVRVDYRQTYRENEAGERIVLNTRALRVVLMKTAAPEGALRSRNEAVTP